MRFNPILIILSCISCYEKQGVKDCETRSYDTPEIQWFSSYNGSEEESHGHFIKSLSDGSFLQIGETGFVHNLSSKILIIKVDSNGDLIWKKEISSSGINMGNSIIEMDDGYLISCSIDDDSALILLDKFNGEIIFSSQFDNGGSDAYEHSISFGDTIASVGYYDADDRKNTFYTEGKGILSFHDEKGNKNYDVDLSIYISQAYRIKKYKEFLYISGLSYGAEDYTLIKTNLKGEIIWKKSYGGERNDHNFGMDINDIGEIFLTGHTLSGTQNWDTYTIKVDLEGNKIWESVVGNPRGFNPKYIHDEVWGIKNTPDGGCIIVAGTGDEYEDYNRTCSNTNQNSSIWNVYLIKFMNDGQIDWEVTYGNKSLGNWAGEDIDLTDDGGAIIAVDNGEFGFLKIKSFN